MSVMIIRMDGILVKISTFIVGPADTILVPFEVCKLLSVLLMLPQKSF